MLADTSGTRKVLPCHLASEVHEDHRASFFGQRRFPGPPVDQAQPWARESDTNEQPKPFSHELEGRAARSTRANWPPRTASGAAHRAPCFFSVDEKAAGARCRGKKTDRHGRVRGNEFGLVTSRRSKCRWIYDSWEVRVVQVRLGTAHQGGGQQHCRTCVAEKRGRLGLQQGKNGRFIVAWVARGCFRDCAHPLCELRT